MFQKSTGPPPKKIGRVQSLGPMMANPCRFEYSRCKKIRDGTSGKCHYSGTDPDTGRLDLVGPNANN